MDLREILVEMEERFWTDGEDFYREHLADEALMAFPEPAGVMERDATVEAIAQAPRWKVVEFEEVRVLRPGPEVAVLVYKAEAQRPEQEAPYSAVVSSLYVRRAGTWRLAFHQQTPSPSAS